VALSDEIRALRDRAIGDLTLVHDYYFDTQTAWKIVRSWVTAGNTIQVQNPSTGTTTTDRNLIGKVHGYATVRNAEATFQQFIAIFESFVADLLRLWLVSNPQALLTKEKKKDDEPKVGLSAILAAADKDALVRGFVERRVNGVMYDRPTRWFGFLSRMTQITSPTKDEIARVAEAKASRDVLIHNRGIIEHQYLEKAGTLARFKAGEQIEIGEQYHQDTWELLRKLVADTADAAAAKAA
jgi:hypothetical protein